MTTPPSPVYLAAISHRPTSLRAVDKTLDIGVPKWERHIGVVGNEIPPLRPDIDQILDSECPVFPGKMRRETSIPILIVQTVKGIPLENECWEQLMNKPLVGNPMKFLQYRAPDFVNQFAPAAHWVLAFRGIVPESEGQTPRDHLDHLARMNRNSTIHYRFPTVLEASVCIAMASICKGVNLLPDDTYMWCKEEFKDGDQMLVGGVTRDSFSVIKEPRWVSNRLYGLGCVGIL